MSLLEVGDTVYTFDLAYTRPAVRITDIYSPHSFQQADGVVVAPGENCPQLKGENWMVFRNKWVFEVFHEAH